MSQRTSAAVDASRDHGGASGADPDDGGRVHQTVTEATGLVEKVTRTRIVRSLQHYSTRRGAVLAAGMAYQAIFAIFAAIFVGFSVAGFVLAANPALLERLIAIIQSQVPGLIGDGGAVSEQDLLSANITFSVSGILALAGLVWKAISWLGTTRSSIRVIFDAPQVSTSIVVQKARDLGLAVLFGVLLIASALVSVIIRGLAGFLLSLVGFDSSSIVAQVVLTILSLAVSTLVNLVALAGMYRVLSRVAIPFRRLMAGALIAALGLTVLSQLSGLVLRGASSNPLLASFAVIVGLLIWFGFVCQVILIAASWIATGMEDDGIPTVHLTPQEENRKRLADLRQARLTIAQAEVRHLLRELEGAHGLRRHRLIRRAERAQGDLAELERLAPDEDPLLDARS